MMRTKARLLGLVSVSMTLPVLMAGCSATGGSSSSESNPPNRSNGASTLEWKECDGGFDCATLQVPLDHTKPDGETIEIGVTRHRADNPSERIGVLLINPGGPGGSATELAHTLPRAGELGDRFDIIGMDPRGVDTSSELDCHSHLQEIYDADPTVDSAKDKEELLSTSKDFVQECKEKYGSLLGFMGTTDVAKDMDLLRSALGEEQISYLGYSYGTSLGQEYARLFPTRVRAMILDGVVDHGPDGLDMAKGQAAGFELAFETYVRHCRYEGCGFGARDNDVAAVIDEVISMAETNPIPAPNADRPATPGTISVALARGLYSDQLWSQLSSALRDGLEGDASGIVQMADEYLGREPDGSYGGGFEVYFSVTCLDDPWPKDVEKYFEAAAAAEKESPRFGAAIVIDYLRCAMWPVDPKPLKPIPSDIEGLAPILVVSTTGDPATPHENAVEVANQISGSVLVTNVGRGHTIVLHGKPCIDDIAMDYLIDLKLPDANTRCE